MATIKTTELSVTYEAILSDRDGGNMVFLDGFPDLYRAQEAVKLWFNLAGHAHAALWRNRDDGHENRLYMGSMDKIGPVS